jgi:hypothetical protein
MRAMDGSTCQTVTPKHMRSNAAVDFMISDSDMAILKDAGTDTDYGEASMFPVFGRSGRWTMRRGAFMLAHHVNRLAAP